jgi:hypothetical protein
MDYQSNSHKKKQEAAKQEAPKKDIQAVVSAKEQKKPWHRRMRGIVFGGEFQSAGKYILADVLLPAARNLIVDATTKGIERMVYGDAAPRRSSGTRYDGRPRVSYHSPSRYREDPRRDMRPPDQPPRPVPSGRQTSEIVFDSREDAEKVLDALFDILDQYEIVAVADLNALVGLPSANVDHKWGWGFLGGTEVRQIREGWVLELPEPEPIH